MNANNPETNVDHVRSVFHERTDLLSEISVPPFWPFSWNRNSGWSCFITNAILASNISKLGNWIKPWIERDGSGSSTDSTISTCLIHNIASEENWDKNSYWVLNLIFQHENVETVVKRSKMKLWDLQSLLINDVILWSFCWKETTHGWWSSCKTRQKTCATNFVLHFSTTNLPVLSRTVVSHL